jgi:hypothetical protein
MQPDTKLFDVVDSSERLGGCSPWTLRKHIAIGNVPVVRIGRRIFLNEETIARIARDGLPSLKARG